MAVWSLGTLGSHVLPDIRQPTGVFTPPIELELEELSTGTDSPVATPVKRASSLVKLPQLSAPSPFPATHYQAMRFTSMPAQKLYWRGGADSEQSTFQAFKASTERFGGAIDLSGDPSALEEEEEEEQVTEETFPLPAREPRRRESLSTPRDADGSISIPGHLKHWLQRPQEVNWAEDFGLLDDTRPGSKETRAPLTPPLEVRFHGSPGRGKQRGRNQRKKSPVKSKAGPTPPFEVPGRKGPETALRASLRPSKSTGSIPADAGAARAEPTVRSASRQRQALSTPKKKPRLPGGLTSLWEGHSQLHVVRDLLDRYAADPLTAASRRGLWRPPTSGMRGDEAQAKEGSRGPSRSGSSAGVRRPRSTGRPGSSDVFLENYVLRQAEIERLLQQQAGATDVEAALSPGIRASPRKTRIA